MKPSDISQLLRLNGEIGIPTYIEGPPGAGKTELVDAYARDIGYGVMRYIASEHEPVDVTGGIQITPDGKSRFCPPEDFPASGNWVLHLDDLHLAPPPMQGVLLRLVREGKVGSAVLPPQTKVVGCGNSIEHRAGAHKMLTPLSNRFCRVTFEVDVNDWVAWALSADVATDVISFIRLRRDLLNQFDAKLPSCPTPRSVELVSRMVKQGTPRHLEFERIKGATGEGWAVEFLAFLKLKGQLPAPSQILLDPEHALVPTEPSALYAITGALADLATDRNFPQVIRYCNRLPVEFAAMTIRDVVARDAARKQPLGVTNCRAYIEWESKNQHILN